MSHDENILGSERGNILKIKLIYGGYKTNQDRKVELRIKFIYTCYLSKIQRIRIIRLLSF